jgi:hypothetical protein
VFYFTMRERERFVEPVRQSLRQHGFVERQRYRSNLSTNLFVFERTGRPSPPLQDLPASVAP